MAMAETWQVDGHRVIEVGSADAPVRRVKAGLVSGRVDVVAHDEPEGRLEVHDVHGSPLDVSWDGHTLEIRHPKARWDDLFTEVADRLLGRSDDSAEVSIAVPRSVVLELGTVSAEGVVAGLSGRVEMRTVSGVVTLDSVTGPVEARSVSGSVEARNQQGEIQMRSVSGSFVVQSDGAPAMTAKTVSGSLSVDVVRAPSAVEFSSVSGGLVLRQPNGDAYDAELRSVNGRVVVGGQQVRGTVGSVKHTRRDPGAGVRVRASTVSGDITLLSA